MAAATLNAPARHGVTVHPERDETAAGAGIERVRVRHRGRMTSGQARALADLSPRYVVEWPVVSAAGFPAIAFGRDGPLAVEVGFGNGNALVAFAKAHPHWNCLGVDVYLPGFGAVMLACEREEVANVRIVNAEATMLLRSLAPGGARLINVFFPDPWPKKRHGKRRLVNAEFAAAAAACLQLGGSLTLATDAPQYAAAMEAVFAAAKGLAGGPASRPECRPVTPFEAKALAAGRVVAELAYRRVG